MNLNELELSLNRTLHPETFHDFCPNGLLLDALGNKTSLVHKVVTGVSLRDDLISAAIDKHADAIIVHHPNGFWQSDKDKRILNSQYARYMRRLVNAGISLFGYHLPLDAHETLGNNATVYRMLNLEGVLTTLCLDGQYRDFTKLGPDRFGHDDICYGGKGIITDELLAQVFPHGYQSFEFEPGHKYKVAICTGSGTSEMEYAADHGYDMFVTGEIRESTPIFAKERGMAVISAGHHRSEVFCVRNVAEWLTEGGVDAEFVDIDNPI